MQPKSQAECERCRNNVEPHTYEKLDDSQLLLWCWKHADFRYDNYHAHGVHAPKVQLGRGGQQFLPEHFFVHWHYSGFAVDQCPWEWVAFYDTGALGAEQRIGHLGRTAFRTAMAEKHGRGSRLEAESSGFLEGNVVCHVFLKRIWQCSPTN